jgi:lipoprotein-releasing system permease protein
LNLSYFIAKRISREQKDGFSSTINRIGIVTIAIGLGAAIVSFLIMMGFQQTVKNKIYSFSSHLLVTKFTMNNSMEEQGFFYNIDLVNHPEKYPMVDHVEEFAHKAGLVKTEEEVMGVVFKGVGKSFDLNRFAENLIEGRFIHFPDSGYAKEIVLSKTISDKLKIKIGDDIMVHFFQNPPRFRKLNVVGLYETNLSEYFDSKIIIGDIGLVSRLNNWADSVAGGLQVYVDFNKFNRSDLFKNFVSDNFAAIWESDAGVGVKLIETIKLPFAFDFQTEALQQAHTTIGEMMDYDLYIEKSSETYQQVFEWLGLISRQVKILLVIILTVVCVNIISVVLILVMERTQMIGMLKALGSTNGLVQSIFIYNGVNLILKGLFFGNLLGLGLCYLQDTFKFIKLNPHDYYMSYVPIDWNWEIVVLLNILVLFIVTLVLLLPTAFVSRISPMKAIRFD